MANWHIAYCMQDVHNILLYCNTDVVIIKPVTGRTRICSASLKTTRRLIALGFHKEKEVCQHSHSSDPVPVHTIRAICCNILLYAIYVALQYCYILIYCDSSMGRSLGTRLGYLRFIQQARSFPGWDLEWG